MSTMPSHTQPEFSAASLLVKSSVDAAAGRPADTDSPPGTAAAWMIQKFVDQDAKERTKATHSPGNRSRPIRGGRKARIK
jgi:hypothetical protein